MNEQSLLRLGIYNASEAAALIGVSEQKVRRWVSGWSGNALPPIITNDLGWIEGKLAFSFANLMELRFIAFFEGAGVKLRVIRSIMDDVRTELRSPHPFATNIIFKTDGAKIVAEIANKSGASNLYDLRSKNFEMKTVIYKSLKDGVIFDPKGDARAWFPRRDIAPNVIVHPRLAFGRPVIKRYGIPTETLASAVKVEGSVEMVAELYEVSEGSVREAVSFEQNIRRAA